MKTCTVEVNGVRCERPHKSKGRCLLHWKRQRAGIPDTQPIREVSRWTGSPQRGNPCGVSGCGRPIRSQRLCSRHLDRKRKDPGAWSGPLMPHPASIGIVELSATSIYPHHEKALKEEMQRRGLKHRSHLVREALEMWCERMAEERRQESLQRHDFGRQRNSGPRRSA